MSYKNNRILSCYLVLFLSTTTTLPWGGDAFSNPSSTSVRTRRAQNDVGSKVPSTRNQHPSTCWKRKSSSNKQFSDSMVLQESLLREGDKRRSNQHSSHNPTTVTSSTNSNGGPTNNRRWHRRFLSRLRMQRNDVSSESTTSTSSIVAPRRMTVLNEEETRGQLLLDSMNLYDEQFLLRNFDAIEPQTVLEEIIVDPSKKSTTKSKTLSSSSTTIDTLIDSEFYDVSISPAVKETHTNKSNKRRNKLQQRRLSKSKSLSVPRLMASLVENILTSRVVNNALEVPSNLKVEVKPLEHTLSRLLLKGQFRANAKISTERLVFKPIRFSKGTVELEEVTLNLFGFLQKQQQPNQGNNTPDQSSANDGVVRYPKQFDIHVQDLTMSRHDLMFSPCIKNGLRMLLIKILKDRGVQSSSIQISSIDILPSGKISCAGEATTLFGSSIPFEVRSGISFANSGHVLTFPGLEVSLNRDIGLFVPVVPTIDLDVGHNARFLRIHIDGKKKQIQLDASVTITPDRTIRLMRQYVQNSEAFAARFSYDVGQWLTRLGRFTK